MNENEITPEIAVRLARHIAERAARLLEDRGIIASDGQRNKPAFYVWPRPDRVILILDPLAVENVDRVLNPRFVHHLATVLGGRRIVSTNSRGIFLQVAYYPAPTAALGAQPLDLAAQPSPLHLPIGMTARGPLWLELPEMDAVLVGGSRRMGKTRLLHGWIQALARGGQALLFLWDGKGGVEFARYRGQADTTVAVDLAEALAAIGAEMARRAELFRQNGAPALPEYNAAARDRLPRIVLVVDEAAFIPDEAQRAVADLVARGGAFGVHPVFATQRPDAQAVQALVKANLSTRIALPVPGSHDSQVILGRTGAEKLAKRPGRLLLVWGGQLVEAQAFQVDLPGGDGATPNAPVKLISQRERKLVEAALALGGWFHIRKIGETAGESRDWVNAVAKRWEAMGYLTAVQTDENGHRLGRRVTDALVQAAGLGGQADWADRAD